MDQEQATARFRSVSSSRDDCSPPDSPTRHRRPLAVVLLTGMTAGILLSTPDAATWATIRALPPSWSVATPDIDTALIHGGLVQAPNFADTLRWWTGTWVGQVPFYRPLTSYVFWFEWKAFGDREYLYLLPTIAIHALACGLFGLLVYRLAEQYRVRMVLLAALVGALGFAGFLSPQRLAAASAVAGAWKNQPDSLAAAFLFSALLFYLRAREGRPRALLGTVACYLLACGFKEIAVLFPAVCIAVEAPAFLSGDRRPVLLRVAALAAAGTLFLAVRFAAIRGLGYTYGSNRSWLMRTVGEAFGPFGGPLITFHWLGPALACWYFALACAGWFAWQRIGTLKGRDPSALRFRLLIALAALAVVGSSALGATYYSGLDPQFSPMNSPSAWITGLLVALDPNTSHYAVTGFFGLAVLLTLLRHRPWILALAAVWTWTFLLPLVVSPGPSHRYYLSQAGYAIAYSLAVGLWGAMLLDSGRLWRGRRRGSAPQARAGAKRME